MNTLILSFSQIHRDPRVLRQIAYLESQNARIFLSGLSGEVALPFIPLLQRERTLPEKLILVATNLLNLNRYKEEKFIQLTNLSSLEEWVETKEIGTVLANDLETWPVAFALKEKNPQLKIVLDAHEYYPRHLEDRLFWKLMHRAYYNHVCEKYIPKADVFITVADQIGKEYEKEFKVTPKIILNSPDYEKGLKPLNVDEGKIKLVHHGTANSSRKLEKMIHMMDWLDSRFHLYFILMPSDYKYLNQLKKLSKGKQIYFLEPVPTKQIPAFINQFDLGVFLLEPVNFNYEHALPNKFFEFVQARLGLAIGPSKEMKAIVEKYELGVVSENFDEATLAKKINSLTAENIFQFKLNSDRSAAELSNQNNIRNYKDIFEGLNYP